MEFFKKLWDMSEFSENFTTFFLNKRKFKTFFLFSLLNCWVSSFLELPRNISSFWCSLPFRALYFPQFTINHSYPCIVPPQTSGSQFAPCCVIFSWELFHKRTLVNTRYVSGGRGSETGSHGGPRPQQTAVSKTPPFLLLHLADAVMPSHWFSHNHNLYCIYDIYTHYLPPIHGRPDKGKCQKKK